MKKIIFSLVIGFGIGVIITELLRNYIFFSLFIGIPAGILSAVAAYIIMKRKELF